MFNLLRFLTQLGVTDKMTPSFAKKIRLTNLLGMMFSVNMALSAVAFIYLGFYKLAIFTLFFVATELTWLLFNYCYLYGVSRNGMLISSNLLGFIVSVYLPGTNYNHGFFVMAGLPFLLFDLSERRSLLLGIVLPLILFPLSGWGQYAFTPSIGSLNISQETQQFISVAITSIYIVLIFLMFLFFSRENARAGRELEEQRSKSYFSSKFAALGEMASGIAHEINNPMTILELTASEMDYMIKDKNYQDLPDRISKIRKTVGRVEKIVDSMRSFSREASREAMELTSLSEIIGDTLIFCAERFKKHNVVLTCNVPVKDVFLKCRSVQIAQVLLNLLNNAFDAVFENSEKRIWIEASLKDQIITLKIKDNGLGIPTDIHDKIFEPFFTTKPVCKGTGLGLSLSKQIIKDHAGRIYLDKATQEMTTFVVELMTTDIKDLK